MNNMKEQHKTSQTRKRILIVDDHPVVRQGLAQFINLEPDLEVCEITDSKFTCSNFFHERRFVLCKTCLSNRRQRIYHQRGVSGGNHKCNPPNPGRQDLPERSCGSEIPTQDARKDQSGRFQRISMGIMTMLIVL